MAETTIIPFSTLPSCAASCGPLYDVNGKCVPPATAAASVQVYEQCFCADSRLAAFSSTTAGPCDAACAATPDGFGSITSWYQSMCSSVQALVDAGTTTVNADGSTTTILGSSSSGSSKSQGGGGGWLSTHWQWVVFIVIMVVGIAGIWIGAAIWRRHYLRKKDRQYALGKNLARHTGSGENPYGGGPMGRSGSVRAVGTEPASFMSGTGNADDEKPRRKLFGRS
ncbi:unnamed protein product [Discula destructiva]